MPEGQTLSVALKGCTVLLPVDRRSGELTAALARHGAQVRVAPALTIVPHIDDAELISRTKGIIADPPHIVVATTGVGFRGWIETADEAGVHEELLAALGRAQIVARGPKARGAIQQAGLTADWVAESETSAELRDFLLAEGVAGRHVAVQHHGSGADGLDEALVAAGARVTSLTVYRWGPPPDAGVVERSTSAAATGDYDAALFTSAPGAREWLDAAERSGNLEAVRARAQSGAMLFAAVGPITAMPLRASGIDPLVPDRGRLGSLVRCVVTALGGPAAALSTIGGPVHIRTGGALINGRFVALPRSGVDLLRALADRAGSVVSREQLLAELPRGESNTHAVDVAIGRLRDALDCPGLIKTVYKRGYLLATDPIGEPL